MSEVQEKSDVLAEKQPYNDAEEDQTGITLEGKLINASGHGDQLRRQYGFLSICGMALTVDNAWVALGNTLYLAISNGGPPGVLYELLTSAFYYSFIAASLAELASAIPSAGGVYHWATLAGGRHGRVLGMYTAYLNFFGWLFDLTSIVYQMSQIIIQIYLLYHPDYVLQNWHIFVCLAGITWLCIAATIFLNRFLPALQQIGLFIVLVGGVVTIIVVAAMPKQHASQSFVWTDWQNQTGWSSGVAFLAGVLNGAFTIGTPDAITHMAEELPNPRKDIPRAIAAQLILGTITAFCYGIAICYGINNLQAVVTAQGAFPLAQVYLQATGSRAATVGLLIIILLSLTPCMIGTFLTVGRTWWALARDNATPFPGLFARVNETLSCPIPATLFTGVMTTALGAISIGSKTALVDLAGSFVILSTCSYALPIAAHLLSGRRNVPPGWFWMGKLGFVVNAAAVLFIILFNIMFCFPAVLPTTVATMNYNSVILVGVLVLTTFWWFVWGIWRYPGPKLSTLYADQARRSSKI